MCFNGAKVMIIFQVSYKMPCFLNGITYLCFHKSEFMTIKSIDLITFSPTHTSKQIGEAIVRGTGLAEVGFVDATLQMPEKTHFEADTLAVIAVPVYGGVGADEGFSGRRYAGGRGGGIWQSCLREGIDGAGRLCQCTGLQGDSRRDVCRGAFL